MKKPLLLALSLAALFPGIQSVHGQAFQDTFDVNSSASWTTFFSSTTNQTDYTLQFAFDYSTNKFVRNGVTNTIPSAPNSIGGTTKGLKITVNKNDNTNAPAAVSLYPTGQSFSGDYSLKFDMWMNYNGGAYGGVDSTEQANFGLNHSGAGPVCQTNAMSPQTFGDGEWFSVAGEAGTAPDYFGFVGTGASSGNLGTVFFPDRDQDTVKEDSVSEVDAATHPLKLIFPSPTYESAGAPGKQWVQVEVRQVGSFISWLINGYTIIEHNQITSSSGNIMLGYIDPFRGIPSPKEDVFIIYDNVRVFTNIATPTVVSASVLSDASEPANAGTFRISRTGSTASSLNVTYQVLGTAKSGFDYTALSGTATIPAGVDFVDVPVTPINDAGAEGTETIVLSLKSGTNYDVGTAMMATMNLTDDGDTTPVVSAKLLKSCYELISARPAQIELSVAQAVGSSLTVNYSLSGTATNGVHYTTIPTSATISAGETNAIVSITPINDNVINSNRTVILNITSGSYIVGNTNATALIRNDDYEAGALLFSDDFEGTTSTTSTNWSIFRTKPGDPVTFNYDYSNITNDLPIAPHTTNTMRKGLKIEVNVFTTGAGSGVSVSPTNRNFTGDYRLRFDGWINYNGPVLLDGGSQSTEWLTAGIGTSGTHLQSQTNDSGGSLSALDGIWFAIDGDGGNVSRDIRAYRNEYRFDTAVDQGIYAAGSTRASDVYYSFMGGVEAPAGQKTTYPTEQDTGKTAIGNAGFEWHDWVITKKGATVTWEIDGILFATVTTNNAKWSTNIFVGSYDPTSGVNPKPDLQYVMIDNLRVESLNPPTPATVTTTQLINGKTQIQIDFSGSAGDAAGSFTLQSAAVVNGPYNNVAATIVSTGTGTFRATANVSGSMQFYRIVR